MPINTLNCSQNFTNTGVGECDLIPGHIIGIFIVPDSFALNNDNDSKTQLADAAIEDNQNGRILPIHNFVGVTDNTSDLKEESLGYGGISVVSEGKYDLTFRLGRGGTCLQKRLRNYNDRKPSVILVDSNGMLFGQLSDGGLKGIPLELFYAKPFTFSDGDSKTTEFSLRIVFDPKYLNDVLAFVDTTAEGFMPSEISGLADVDLSDSGSTIATIKVTASSCAGGSILETYDTELTGNTLWTLYNVTNSSAAPIDSVSITNGVATITPTSPFTTNDLVKVSLANVSTLTTAGVTGVEGHSVIIKVV